MKAIGMFLLSVGLVGSLCGCQTTIPDGKRTTYYFPQYQTGGKLMGLPGIAQQKATVRATMKERVSGGNWHQSR
jgi:hypothetical protein